MKTNNIISNSTTRVLKPAEHTLKREVCEMVSFVEVLVNTITISKRIRIRNVKTMIELLRLS